MCSPASPCLSKRPGTAPAPCIFLSAVYGPQASLFLSLRRPGKPSFIGLIPTRPLQKLHPCKIRTPTPAKNAPLPLQSTTNAPSRIKDARKHTESYEPSFEPSEEEPSDARAGEAKKARFAETKTPAEKQRPTLQIPQAVALYRTRYFVKKGRYPSRHEQNESRACHLLAEHGEGVFERALDGYFGDMGGTDEWPQKSGYDLINFVRQFDRWEGGSRVKLPPKSREPITPPGESALVRGTLERAARWEAQQRAAGNAHAPPVAKQPLRRLPEPTPEGNP